MIGRAFLPLVLASAVFAVLLGPSAAQSACCSQSHRTCESWTAKTYADCQKQNDGKLVWLPQGPETKTCFQRGNNTSCKVHNDCCGTLVCESVGWNFRIKQCQHPIDACAVYNRDPVRCNTKSSCVFRDSKCVPNFNFTIKDPLTLPKDIPDDPACCSQNFRNCTMWSPATQVACLNATGRNVWLPGGDINTTCIDRGRNNACKVHEDCCSTLVCDGLASNVKDKKCHHPIDLCSSFRDEPYCITRSSCMWNGTRCIPNFDSSVNLPANKPKNIPDDPGCCSQNCRTCPTWSPKWAAACAADRGNLVWLPGGETNTTCIPRWNTTTCRAHEDCCGTLVCDGMASNVKDKKCHHPVDLCRSFRDEPYCITRSSCMWNGTQCIPNFSFTVSLPENKPKNIPDSPACCSQNYRTCPTWTPKWQAACAADRGNLVWLPGGEINTTCIPRWNSTTCRAHEDCCATLVCDGLASNVRDKKCYHPIDLCRSFRDEPYCNTRSSCMWNGTQCIPNFNFTVNLPENKPKNVPDDPACCSQNYRTCPTWTPKFQAPCAADKGNLVWLPGGEINTTCIPRWNSTTCKVHEDCCATLVCDGMSWNHKDKKCYHPIDLCGSYKDEPFCKTRSSCMWNGTACRPNYDFTVNLPANKPKNIPDDPGCCSQNHLECPRWTPKTWEQCKTTQDGTYVWIPQGNRAVPNPDTCLPRWNNTECTKHDDCCGSMVCAASPWNALKLLCRHPLELCSDGNPTRQFCNNVPGCAWSNNKCVPAFDYTVVNPAAKGVLPAPRIIKTADNGNADFLGLCKGYVASVWGDPHIISFDRRKYDCQATGAFTLVEAKGQIEIQGMFHKRNASMFPSVLVGVAIAYPDIPNVPRIQLNVAEYDAGPNQTIALGGKCGGHLYINGVLQAAKRGDAIVGDGYVIVINKNGGVDIQYFNGDNASSAVRITTGGDPDKSFGCLMTLIVCLPFNEPDLLEEAVGLLGTPNGNTTDEWTTPTGSVLAMQQYGKATFDYCTTHYCVESQRDSLFVYEKISHKARYSCSHSYPGDVDLTNPTPELLELCGAEDADCLLEGMHGGIERALENIKIEKKISDIAVSPNLIPEAKFNLPIPCFNRTVGDGKCATADGICQELDGKCEIVGPFTGPPVASPTPEPAVCTGSLEIVKNNANVSLPTGAVTYANGNGSTVTVTITQKWKTDSISWIAPVYKKPSGNVTCDTKDKVEEVKAETATSYTLQCETNLNYATLTVLVHDGSYTSKSSTNNTFGCAGWGNDNGIVPYELRIPCGPCPGSSPTPAPVTPTPAPVTPTPAPVEPTPAPVTPTPAPVDPTPAPVTPTPAPVDPTPAPVDPTPAPVDPTPAPVTPTPAPVDPTPAPAPGNPTPAPVDPTPAPVDPTPAPVDPTPAPVTPTAGPAGPSPPSCPYPVPSPPECPSDVVQMADVNTELPFMPITIVSQDDKTVNFTITNPFREKLRAVYYQYATGTTGVIQCYSEDQFASCPEPIELTAHCLTLSAKSLAIVDIWFVDPAVIDGADIMTIPDCCHPEEQTIPTAHYTFKVYCESTCPNSNPSRRTLSGLMAVASKSADEFERVTRDDGISFERPQQDTASEGHFCSSIDHPCGENGKMVNVCHYSRKDGYQTYCVRESDSDVIAYVPKDYCGPCAGGYQSTPYRN